MKQSGWLRRAQWLLLLTQTAWVSATGGGDCTGINAVRKGCSTGENAMIRETFFVGGDYVYQENLDSSIFSGQMYVEKLSPALGFVGLLKPNPLVLISAGVPSGASWLNTPDNRKGWASYFVSRGYTVYIVDTTSVGRSSQSEFSRFPMKIGSTDTITENAYTAPENLNPYPQSQGHTQWPGSGTRGDPFFEAFMASILPLTSNTQSQELSMRSAGCKLLSMIGAQSYLISHSAGGTYTALMSDECPDLIKGNVNIEPGNVPFQSLVGNNTVPAVGYRPSRPCGLSNTPITYDPPIADCSELESVEVGEDTLAHRSCYMQTEPARQLPNLVKVPYMMLTGSASPHITYDHCTIDFLEQAGVKTDWIKLGEIGIEGNGHFLHLEKNNLKIAAVVDSWISRDRWSAW